MYDLNLWPIRTHKGQPLGEQVGLLAANPPRRAVRSRAEDLLILALYTQGSGRISIKDQQSWLTDLPQVFFKTSGSVTSALRSLVESLNLSMLEKNLKNAKEGGPTIGAMNAAALHRRSLYLVQSGKTHAYVLSRQGLEHFSDASPSDRGLGLSRSPTIRYYRAELGEGGYLFMTDSPPKGWTEEFLLLDGFPSLEQLRRRLLHQASPNFRLDLIQIVLGEGKIQVFPMAPRAGREEDLDRQAETLESQQAEIIPPVIPSLSPEQEELDQTQELTAQKKLDAEEVESVAEAGEDILPEVKSPEEGQEIGERAKTTETSMPEHELQGQPVSTTDERTASKTESEVVPQIPSTKPTDEERKEETTGQAKINWKDRLKQAKSETLSSLDTLFDKGRSFQEKVNGFFSDLFTRWLPGDRSGAPRLSNTTLLLIALGVPIIVVAIAVGVYLARGRTLQYEHYYNQAQAASQIALAAEDPNAARSQWMQALTYLEQAEAFRSTGDTSALREDAQDALDALDGAARLAYRPAIAGELYSEINIQRIISYGLDLYLFDATGGRVIHATGGGQGYEIDPEFVCAAGNFGGGGVGELVDMAVLPINNPYQAHLIAVDSVGNVVYCSPGQDPVVQSLPASGSGELNIQKIAFANSSLYALDGNSMMVWVFPATNGQFLDSPVNFFAEAQPNDVPDMRQVIDLAVNGSELYLLRNNGELLNCVYTGLPGDPLNCELPVTYVDGRPGKEEQRVLMPEGNFNAVLYTTPPDPSIFILDASSADIYQFSLRFRLHQRLRPDLGDYEIDSPEATAFTIGIDQIAFVAFGNQVFYAYVE